MSLELLCWLRSLRLPHTLSSCSLRCAGHNLTAKFDCFRKARGEAAEFKESNNTRVALQGCLA